MEESLHPLRPPKLRSKATRAVSAFSSKVSATLGAGAGARGGVFWPGLQGHSGTHRVLLLAGCFGARG